MKNIICILIVPAALVLVGCGNRQKEAKIPQTIQQIQSEKGIPVTTSKIGYGTVKRIEQCNGTLQGSVEATLANGMGGTVKEIRVEVGKTVKKNATVAVMDIDGGSPIDVAQSAYDYAEKTYERTKKLLEQGAISKEQVEGARVQYEDAKRNLGQARVGVNVTAPFAGTVIEIYESIGSKIGSKTPLVKIADLTTMKVEMLVNERAIDLYKNGQKAFLLIDTDTIWGTIDRIALGANGLAHNFKVTALFPNSNRRLKPGQFKQVHTVVKEKTNALYVPIETVNFSQDNIPYLFTLKDGNAVKTDVVLGITTGLFYEIVNGCTSDDQIIMSGLTMLHDGIKVNVVNE